MNFALYTLSFATICYFVEELKIISLELMFIGTINILCTQTEE